MHVILRSKEQNLSKGTAMQCHTTRRDGGCTDQLVGKCQVANKRIADSWSCCTQTVSCKLISFSQPIGLIPNVTQDIQTGVVN